MSSPHSPRRPYPVYYHAGEPLQWDVVRVDDDGHVGDSEGRFKLQEDAQLWIAYLNRLWAKRKVT